jgi:hypothetical protein
MTARSTARSVARPAARAVTGGLGGGGAPANALTLAGVQLTLSGDALTLG